jgi:hypothetical protein
VLLALLARPMQWWHRSIGQGKEDVMCIMARTLRWFAAVALAYTTGILPSCASMGGGGMRYVVSDPIPIEQGLSI